MDEKEFKHLLGRLLRRKRIECNLTQERLAEYADLNEKHLGQIELGNKQPNTSTYYKLCHALNINSDHLFKEIKKELDS